MISQKDEEILEQIWVKMEEEDKKHLSVKTFKEEINSTGSCEKLEKNGLVEIENERLNLTENGRNTARQIIRRHRLAEVLLSQVLELGETEMETAACEFEHILSENVTERICTFLGHPDRCPHGKPIPSGNCCGEFKVEMKPLITPLEKLKIGESGVISFMVPDSHERLDKLSSLSLVPGKKIKMHQKKPSLVIQFGETTLALDREIAEGIYVKKV